MVICQLRKITKQMNTSRVHVLVIYIVFCNSKYTVLKPPLKWICVGRPTQKVCVHPFSFLFFSKSSSKNILSSASTNKKILSNVKEIPDGAEAIDSSTSQDEEGEVDPCSKFRKRRKISRKSRTKQRKQRGKT